jgi:hypothetical protein
MPPSFIRTRILVFVAANGTVGPLIRDVLKSQRAECVQPSCNVCRLGSRVNSSELSDKSDFLSRRAETR